MTEPQLSVTPARIRTRLIEDADVPEAVDLVTRGYGTRRRREFWEHIFACLGRRPVPEGFPRYGYVIESDGALVGVMLLIFSTIWQNGKAGIRCNGSSIYVDPEFRFYAPLLASRALKDKNVTVLNLTAAKHTRRMDGLHQVQRRTLRRSPPSEPALRGRSGPHPRRP
jgi:hypothetical protein